MHRSRQWRGILLLIALVAALALALVLGQNAGLFGTATLPGLLTPVDESPLPITPEIFEDPPTVPVTPELTEPVETPTPEPTPEPEEPTPTPTPAPAAVWPILECVTVAGDGTFTAFFGYHNEGAELVTIPIGSENTFAPEPAERGQPVTFAPGRSAVWPQAPVRVDGVGSVEWHLNGQTASASVESPACVYRITIDVQWRDDEGNPLDGPPADLPPGFEITARSESSSAVCRYPAGELACEYEGRDGSGLWVPSGGLYTVAESGLPTGWSPLAGIGLFPGAGNSAELSHRVINHASGALPLTPTPTPVETPPAPVETPPAPVETPPAPVETPPTLTETPPTLVETPPAPVETPPAPVETSPAPVENPPTPVATLPAPAATSTAPTQSTSTATPAAVAAATSAASTQPTPAAATPRRPASVDTRCALCLGIGLMAAVAVITGVRRLTRS